ncbi:MAG: hypothetical protein AAF735_06240 [Myxococcota bacterium]
MLRRIVHFSWLTLLLVSGCAAANPYVTQRVSMDTDPKLAFIAIESFVHEQGWTVVETSNVTHRVEALTPIRTLGAVPVRDRWRFHVVGHVLEVTKDLEASFDGVSWQTSSEVCDTYEYKVEHQTISDILDFVENRRVALAQDLSKEPTN